MRIIDQNWLSHISPFIIRGFLPKHERISNLQEDSRVLLVQLDQLQVGDGVYDPHGGASQPHGDWQQHDVVAERYEGEHQRNDESAEEESQQGRQEAAEDRT